MSLHRTLIALLMAGSCAFPQCSQCFRTAAAQQTESMRAVNSGILVMLLPVFTLLAGFCWLAWHRRDG